MEKWIRRKSTEEEDVLNKKQKKKRAKNVSEAILCKNTSAIGSLTDFSDFIYRNLKYNLSSETVNKFQPNLNSENSNAICMGKFYARMHI